MRHGKQERGPGHHGPPDATHDGRAGNRWGHLLFLALLSAVIIFLFVVLPVWLLSKRSHAPPSAETFGPPAASPGAPATDPVEPDREEPVRFE